MGLDWGERDGSYLLTGSCAPYDRHGDRACARIRWTKDGEYFYQLTGTDPDEEPTFYSLLEDCKRDCEDTVKFDLVERKLDRKG